MKVTLGGDRLGSGKKQKLELSHYYRSSFNLEQDWKSSMAPGILYPCLNLIGTNGDTFDIDIDSFIRTLPTKGPLFGSFKLQIDLFACPFRLYQGILHNNPVNIGLKMNQVYLPKLELTTTSNSSKMPEGSNFYTSQIATSSLLKYLGLSGLAKPATGFEGDFITRKINAIPALAYYEVFKNYYANKQEEKAYVLRPSRPTATNTLTGTVRGYLYGTQDETYEVDANGYTTEIYPLSSDWVETHNTAYTFTTNKDLTIKTNLDEFLELTMLDDSDGEILSLYDLIDGGYAFITSQPGLDGYTNNNMITITIKWDNAYFNNHTAPYYFHGVYEDSYTSNIVLDDFKLSNIDDMRNKILKSNELGDEVVIDITYENLPYYALVNKTNEGITWNAFKQNGLVVKTYQSDLFNNWINTDWIEGENGIAAISAVDVSEGSLSMDALNLAEKVYEMLNRVAVTGGTYEDWQEAVYDEKAVRKAESPMYLGGMSAEVMFEEVISNSETKIDGDFQPLGSLGGKGTQVGKNGGNNITVHCTEPTYILGIISLTPRICQTQGNEWYLTELDTLDDLHKPGLDGIGFQDLIVEQMAWWDTKQKTDGTLERSSAGKVPAWINYTTAVDKAYGDFAETGGKAFMVLARNYEVGANNTVKDITTYIDPAKYNYAFAYTDLAAQNFWAQVHFKIVARRKMSAHQIPNL